MASAPGAAAAVGRVDRSSDVRMTLLEAAKKLSLWHTATLRPILTHDDLEPILTAAGFLALPTATPATPNDQKQPGATVAWREYAYLGSGGRSAVSGWMGPRPRLPYPRVDALHLRTYQDFLDAVGVNVGAIRVANLFHIRCMPINMKQDRVFGKVFRAVRNDQDGIIVYRDDILDKDAATLTLCSEHMITEDVGYHDIGYHVIRGNPCRDLICYLRHSKIHGSCDDNNNNNNNNETCNVHPGYINVVLLKDLFPRRPRRNLPA